MRSLLTQPKENAWIASDRRERIKFAAATLALFGSAFCALVAVAYALVAH